MPMAPAAPQQPADRDDRRQDRLLLLLAVAIGALAGIAVAGFRVVIEWLNAMLLAPAVAAGGIAVMVLPTVSGLVVGVLVMRGFPTIRISGVNETKIAVFIRDGFITVRSAVGKFITCSLAIGSGHSVGPEDPGLHIGAAVGSLLGRRAGLSPERLRLIVPVGAAAGLAAAFNAPISAVLFVIEEIVGRWTARLLVAGILAAAASVVVSGWLIGSESIFHGPVEVFTGPADLARDALIGIAGGLASVVFAKAISWLRPRLKALPPWSGYLQPAVAGLLIGAIGYFGAPQVMGAGYEAVNAALEGRFTWQMLAALALLKILATTLSVTSGTPGGMFAPALFIGAMLGGATGGAAAALLPFVQSSAGADALIGMAALFAGFLRAPITAVFMAVEVSGNYAIMVPAMIASMLSYLISRRLQTLPIFDMLSRQDGVELPCMEVEREARVLRVDGAMRPPVAVLRAEESVAGALARLDATGQQCLLVREPGAGWLLARRATLRALVGAGQGAAPLTSVELGPKPPCLYPDDPLQAALPWLKAMPLLPVVHRGDGGKLAGVVSLRDLLGTAEGRGAA